MLPSVIVNQHQKIVLWRKQPIFIPQFLEKKTEIENAAIKMHCHL